MFRNLAQLKMDNASHVLAEVGIIRQSNKNCPPAFSVKLIFHFYQNFRYYFNDSLKLYQSSLFEIKTVNS